MTLELSIIIGFIFHLIGDYLFQNDWMAREKVKSNFAAFIHSFTYSALFLFLVSPLFWLIILGTHFFIDRYRLAVNWIKLVNWNWNSINFGYGEEKPMWMSVWLMIIIDNTFHIVINTATIYFFFACS